MSRGSVVDEADSNAACNRVEAQNKPGEWEGWIGRVGGAAALQRYPLLLLCLQPIG